jgi:ELP3 family radical SAM enzyme/protein acetyltransferase
LRTKNTRSESGVVVITVFTSPYPETSKGVQQFSCEYDCHYCPKEPNQPRSYLLNEPGVARANANNFVSKDQFWDRARTYLLMGHPLDKIELIVSGGTFSSYPREYIINFFRDQFYAANVAYDKIVNRKLREPLSLSEEQTINENDALVKIIGITIETRPDRINNRELIFFRQLGVTRVQMGVQHTSDIILDHIGRRCKDIHTVSGIKLLKEAGFKVDIHLMPDLPHPAHISQEEMVEIDRDMFYQVINLPKYQADQWKIYPCATVPWTEIEKWYKEGSYKPYAEVSTPNNSNMLFDLLIDIKQKIKPWVRINRVIRDIPNEYIMGGNSNPSMRGDLLAKFTADKLVCNCIRCREVGSKQINLADFSIRIRQYEASDGIEYFISWEDINDVLLGFLRLRINSSLINECFPELSDCGLIRELHIYGQVINHNADNTGTGVQHVGLGKRLIMEAIKITQDHKLPKISVIAGTGVRKYYIKQGFEPCLTYINIHGQTEPAMGNFLIKNINDLVPIVNSSNSIAISSNSIANSSNLITNKYQILFLSLIFIPLIGLLIRLYLSLI